MIIDQYSEDYDARAVFAGLKEFHEECAVGEYTRNQIMEDLELKMINWESAHQDFFARWSRLWKQLVDLDSYFKCNLFLYINNKYNIFSFL